MAKDFYESVQIHGGFSGQYYDLNQGPLLPDIIDSLLQNAATCNLQENAPLYLGSTGSLFADRTLALDAAELSGRIFFLRVNNDDIGTNNLIISPSSTINGELTYSIATPGDFILIHQEAGNWRITSLWSASEKADLELELEYSFNNSTSFKELLYTGNNLTTVNIYEDITKVNLLFTKVLSYTGTNLTQTVLTRVSDGATLTKNLSYVGSRLISVEAV